MAMVFDDEKGIIRIDVPNSEANINAQHCGIKDRMVGAYYMSENHDKCFDFLAGLNGEYYIDIPLSIRNASAIIKTLKDKNYEAAFKSQLVQQTNAIKVLEDAIKDGNYYYKMKAPSINDRQKYLKLDNEDIVVDLFKTLVLGDLMSVFIKKIGNNGFLFYLDKCPSFDEKIEKNVLLKWMR